MDEPLDKSKRQIRLLHLLPGDQSAPLRCKFSLVSLDDKPAYEALSYVWGDSERLDSIYVETTSTTVPITNYLYLVLRDVRLNDRERVLWADALCIHQENLEERSNQVSLMADIYQQATCVLAYLGEYWEGCEQAAETINQLADGKHMHSFTEPGLNVQGVGLESIELKECLLRFFDTPWITRTWTVQEFLLAKNVNLMYGRVSVSGRKASTLDRVVSKHRVRCCGDQHKSAEWIEKNNHGPEMLRKWNIATLPWNQLAMANDPRTVTPEVTRASSLVLLELFSARQAHDPHDKVYGMLGVGQLDWAKLIHPDYTATLQHTYQMAVMADIKVTGRLEFLSFCDPDMTVDWPSWIPDWRIVGSKWVGSPGRTRFSVTHDASGGRVADTQALPGEQLAASGKSIGNVEFCASPIGRATKLVELRPQLVEIRSSVHLDTIGTNRYCDTAWSISEAYHLALVGG